MRLRIYTRGRLHAGTSLHDPLNKSAVDVPQQIDPLFAARPVRIFSSGGLIAWMFVGLASEFERGSPRSPRQTALGFLWSANLIRPAGQPHEEHFITSAYGSLSNCDFQRLCYQGFFSRIERTAGIVLEVFLVQDGTRLRRSAYCRRCSMRELPDSKKQRKRHAHNANLLCCNPETRRSKLPQL